MHPAEKQVFKLKVYIPNTRNFSRTKILNTRDIKDADSQRIEFIKLLKENNYNLNSQNTLSESEQDRYNLLYQMNKFTEFITNGGTYDFESIKKLDPKTVKDFKRFFRYFLESLDKNYNIYALRVDDIEKNHLELFHKSIKKRSDSIKTYNNIMGYLKRFYNHLIDYEKLKISNPFKLVTIGMVQYEPVAFTGEEFSKVLSVTTYENGWNDKEKRNRFRDWLPTAFRLGLFSCLRLDEVVNIKYCDIIEAEGVSYLMAENEKVNKMLGIKNKPNKRIKRIAVIKQMWDVLIDECDYPLYKDTDKYIIAPELSRTTVRDIICKGFTHFKRVAGIDPKKCFKELRKTYINSLHSDYGIDITGMVSDHSSKGVLEKHYIDQLAAIKMTKDLEIFGKT